MNQTELFLPMLMEARWAIHRLTAQEVIRDILLLLKETTQLSDFEISRRYKSLHRFEQELYHFETLVQMEIVQIYNLSSPKKHKQLTDEINLRIENIEQEFERTNLFELIQNRNIEIIVKTPRPDGEYYFSTRSTEPEKIIEQLVISSFEFDEITEFFLSKIKQVKACVTPHYQVKPRGSYFAPFDFNELVVEPIRFKEVCDNFCKNIMFDDKEVKLLLKIEDSYTWLGNRVGNGIPLLAAFLLRLSVLKIIKIHQTRRFAEFFYEYFSIPLENNNYKFLLDSLRKENKAYSDFFRFEII